MVAPYAAHHTHILDTTYFLQEIDFYVTNYPVDGQKVLGFLDYKLLLGLQLDHIYTAWYFYGSIALLAASLMACTYSTQWPTAKVWLINDRHSTIITADLITAGLFRVGCEV